MESEKSPKKRGRKSSNPEKAKYYVNEATFRAQIKQFYDKPNRRVNSEIGHNLIKIANGLATMPNFINYSFLEDMKGDALIKMWNAMENHKYDLGSVYNPFSYFNKIAFFAFINRIKKEKAEYTGLGTYQEVIYEQYLSTDEYSSSTREEIDAYEN